MPSQAKPSTMPSAMFSWIDTHCHLHAPVFDDHFQAIVHQARQAGVRHFVLPATHPHDWAAARERAHQIEGASYTLGIHPWWADTDTDTDTDTNANANTCEPLTTAIEALQKALNNELTSPGSRLIGLGEIGLDFAKPERATPSAKAQQQALFEAQVDLAITLNLPVVLHVCRAGDLAYLLIKKRLHQGNGLRGVVHAFSGSMEQACAWLNIGFKLGIGGAATYPQAKRLHRLLQDLPSESWVLETDAPFMPPVWLRQSPGQSLDDTPHLPVPIPYSPVELPRIGVCLAARAGVEVAMWAATTTKTAQALFEFPLN
jgi:TatD DNase family protein